MEMFVMIAVSRCDDEDGDDLGVDRLSAWPIIGADIKHFTDYRYRPF